LTDKLTKMNEAFKKEFQTVVGRELHFEGRSPKTSQFVELVVKTVEVSIAGEKTEIPSRVQLWREGPQFSDEYANTFKANLYTAEALQNSAVRPSKVVVKIMKDPFGSGSMRYAYFLNIIDPPNKGIFVAKKWKDDNSRQSCVQQWNCHNVTIQHVKQFNDALAAAGHNEELSCIPIQVLALQNPEEWYTLEQYLPGTFQKHNNNYSFVNRTLEQVHPIMQTFPHFSLLNCNGDPDKKFYMVADIQGVNHTLTDPIILSFDSTQANMKFGKGDLGRVGMRAWIGSHKCNTLCDKLGLTCESKPFTDV